jgi:lipid-A-disaccharide synthase
LIERLQWIRDLDPWPLSERLNLDPHRLVLVVLPGSRTSEVTRLMEPFGQALDVLHQRRIRPQVIIPVVPHLRELIERQMQSWIVKPHLVTGDEDKFRAFKLAHAALAASGTVTLELALAGTPMVVAYKVDALAKYLRYLLEVQSVVLANLVLEENAFPEYLQEACTPENLADALDPLLRDTGERKAQLAALSRIPDKLLLREGGSPSDAAAELVLGYAAHGRRPAE